MQSLAHQTLLPPPPRCPLRFLVERPRQRPPPPQPQQAPVYSRKGSVWSKNVSESCEKNMRMHIYLYLCAYELVCVCAHTQTRYSEQTVEQRSGAKRRAQPSGKRRVQRRRNQGRGVLVELGEQARHSPALAGSSAPCASTASAPCPACLPHSLGWRWGVLLMELLQEICHRRPCAHAKCQQVCRRQCEQGCRGQGLPWPITCPNDPVHPIPRPRLRHGLLTLCPCRPRGTGSVGDSVGEGPQTVGQRGLKRLALGQGSGNRPRLWATGLIQVLGLLIQELCLLIQVLCLPQSLP